MVTRPATINPGENDAQKRQAIALESIAKSMAALDHNVEVLVTTLQKFEKTVRDQGR